MAESAYKRAFSARAAGSSEEAIRLLDVALRVVERTSPDRVALLREMVVVSRMAAAVSPVAPLPIFSKDSAVFGPLSDSRRGRIGPLDT